METATSLVTRALNRLGCAASRRIAAALALVMLAPTAPALPPNFVDAVQPGVFEQAVGLTFAPDGMMFVWEKGGRVWTVEDGVQHSHPLLDIGDEVGNWRDHGLLGFALDPNFASNGYLYLLYVVDYHHAAFFGTPQYNPATNTYFRDSIARLTRYQVDLAGGGHDLVPGSRSVLIGQTLQTALPVCHQSHGTGSLVFGRDGTLLITFGDSASYESADTGGPTSGSSNTARNEGIITPAEDVGAFRAQLVDSHAGKVLRVDPATGLGVPGNPFFDPMNPGAPRSRVWAMGLRNPFRAALRPGTGSTNLADANPGVLYIGDVGWTNWEELNVCRTPGANFGWPIYEGLGPNWAYPSLITRNITAPNPLSNPPACNPFFSFQDLMRHDILQPPSFPNPCNPALQIPASLFRFTLTRPRLDWQHGGGPARVPTYDTNGYPQVAWVGAPGSPVPGPQFGGNSSTGGVWYIGADFPPEFRDVYFHADFVNGWIRAMVMDAQDNLVEVRTFAGDGEVGAIVAMATSPTVPGLFYINYDEVGASRVRRISYVGGSNLPPVATANAAPSYGPSPLDVALSSAGSSDPEGGPLTYLWDFGDNSAPSTLPNPTHVYRDEIDLTPSGTFHAKIQTLSPPNPIGSGSTNPEVIRNLEYPPVGSQDSQRQYDTYHAGQQGNSDWIGFTYVGEREFTGLVFQEGRHFPDGGWFQTLGVQVRSLAGIWADVPGITLTPAYPGNNGVSYESFRINFPPTRGTGVRLAGDPGGSANFISVGELRVLGRPTAPGPRRFDAMLTVCDQAGVCISTSVPVWVNNTPPSAQITAPLNGTFYNDQVTFMQPLLGTKSDAEHAQDELACAWRVILHHNDHEHPEPIDPMCQTQAMLNPHGNVGDTFYWEFQYTVTDPLGLSTTVESSIFPAPPRCPGDADFSGVVSFADITSILVNFNSVGPYGDSDSNGAVNFADITSTLLHFLDVCQP